MENNGNTEIPDVLHEVEKTVSNIEKIVAQKGRPVLARYPFTFTLLAAFAFMSVSYGLTTYFDSVAFIRNNPLIVLGIGIVVLMFTGTLYRYLK